MIGRLHVAGFLALTLCASPALGAPAESAPAKSPVAEIVYRHPTKRAKDYARYFIAPVTLTPANGGALKPEELKSFAAAFTDSARESMAAEKSLTLADQPGPGVLVIQMEVREFEAVKPKATGQGEIAVRFDGTGRGGSLHLTGVDGGSGEKVIELREQLKGPKYLVGDERKRLMNMMDAFHAWGHALRARLVDLKSGAAEPAR